MSVEILNNKSISEKLVSVTLQLPERTHECFRRLAALEGTDLEDYLRDEVLRTFLEIFSLRNLTDSFTPVLEDAETALKLLKEQSKEREKT
ncbi:MAG: hypothetical protein ACFE9L_11355 [Candidatus Hodarchaeota archaeon]